MSLLNPGAAGAEKELSAVFTFHNVSIKSRKEAGRQIPTGALHSTMSLLNQLPFSFSFLPRIRFTFHNVSIKSPRPYLLTCRTFRTLHSTMSLLNRKSTNVIHNEFSFTFHNVSMVVEYK